MTIYPDRLMPETLEADLPSSEPWYVLQTRYRFENKIAAQLQPILSRALVCGADPIPF